MSKWNLNSLALSGLVCVAPSFALAQVWSVEQARDALENDQMILLDIRSREEWEETGLAKGALPVSMHEDGFGANLQRVFNQFPETQIGMICAVGGRSNHVITLLKQNGITDVVDVSEGMIGNQRGAGWIAKGLPVVGLSEAQSSLDALLNQ